MSQLREDIDEGRSESLVLLRRALVVVLLSYFLSPNFPIKPIIRKIKPNDHTAGFL